jgi:hypothetical protein
MYYMYYFVKISLFCLRTLLMCCLIVGMVVKHWWSMMSR